MNFVRRRIDEDVPESLSASGVSEMPLGERKWPIRYDSVESLAIVADLTTIILSGWFSGLLYRFHDKGLHGDIGKSVGSAILVSALFVSVMKIRGMYRPTELLILRNQI